MKRVAIVNAGEWGDLRHSRGDYNPFVETLEWSLKEAKRATDNEPTAQVSVVQSTQEALAWVRGSGCIIYVTRGMFREAKKVAAEHPDIRVVLFTGLLPEGEVVFVGKGWVSSPEVKIQTAKIKMKNKKAKIQKEF